MPVTQPQERLENALLRTFAAFAEDGRPTALFIDDLQWADASTLALLDAVAAQLPANVLTIGACRDNEPATLRHLSRARSANRQHAIPFSRIRVKPRGVRDLGELVAAALDEAPSRVGRLVRAVHVKTGGTPFFSTQLLRALVDDVVLSHPGDRAGWQWDDTDVAHRGYSGNVIDLMIRRLDRLPTAGTELLQ